MASTDWTVTPEDHGLILSWFLEGGSLVWTVGGAGGVGDEGLRVPVDGRRRGTERDRILYRPSLLASNPLKDLGSGPGVNGSRGERDPV